MPISSIIRRRGWPPLMVWNGDRDRQLFQDALGLAALRLHRGTPRMDRAAGRPEDRHVVRGARLDAELVLQALSDGSYRKHLDMMRARLSRAMFETAGKLRNMGVEPWLVPEAGMFLWCRLRPAWIRRKLPGCHSNTVWSWRRETCSASPSGLPNTCGSTSRKWARVASSRHCPTLWRS